MYNICTHTHWHTCIFTYLMEYNTSVCVWIYFIYKYTPPLYLLFWIWLLLLSRVGFKLWVLLILIGGRGRKRVGTCKTPNQQFWARDVVEQHNYQRRRWRRRLTKTAIKHVSQNVWLPLLHNGRFLDGWMDDWMAGLIGPPVVCLIDM